MRNEGTVKMSHVLKLSAIQTTDVGEKVTHKEQIKQLNKYSIFI